MLRIRESLNRVLAATAITLLLAAGCQANATDPSASTRGVTETASPTLAPTPAWTEVAVPTIAPQDFARLVAGRVRYGLAVDARTIQRLRADPTIREAYGALVSAEEQALLDQQLTDQPAVLEGVEAYGRRHPLEYAGVHLDLDGTVVARFTARLAIHEGAIRAAVSPRAKLTVSGARWTLAELEGFRRLIETHDAWFETVDADSIGPGADIVENRLYVLIATTNEVAPQAIIDHFDAHDWMTVRISGPRPWYGPLGSAEVTVTDASGGPAVGYLCAPRSLDKAAATDSNAQTDVHGVCRLDFLPTVRYTIRIQHYGGSGWTLVDEVRITVKADTTTRVGVQLGP